MKLFLTWKYGIHLKEKNNFLKITLTSKGQKLQENYRPKYASQYLLYIDETQQ